jgi:cupin 2 domain-containing protein
MRTDNIFSNVPQRLDDEQILTLFASPLVEIVRIVSTGQASPPDFWYDQDFAEWVVVLAGSAALAFEDQAAPVALSAGDYVEIAPHRRHRVLWTDAAQPTVWLAVHIRPGV